MKAPESFSIHGVGACDWSACNQVSMCFSLEKPCEFVVGPVVPWSRRATRA